MEISKNIFENTEVAFADKSNRDLKENKVLFQLFGNDKLVSIGSSLAQVALKLHLPVSPIFKITVYHHFCGGETFEECKKTIGKLNKRHVSSMLNYGVELKEREEDFEATIQKNQEALEFAGKNKAVKVLCIKLTGFGRFDLFEKVQSGDELSKGEKQELEKVKGRFHQLCKSAAKNKVALYVDAEESWIQDALDGIVEEMMDIYNQVHPVVYNTFQLYRWDRLDYLKTQLKLAEEKKYILGAKLVRGAYMEKERERAESKGYKSPIHKNKKAVDKDFNEALHVCFDNIEKVACCVASQSEESCLLAIELIDKKKIDRKHPHVMFSQLYGMGDNITFNLASLGFNASKYLPYGPVKDVIPYLIRRARENSSVGGQMGRELKLVTQEMKRRGM